MAARRFTDFMMPALGVASEDKDLVVAFKDGEVEAYAVIYDRYVPRVRSVCRKMLRAEEDSNEAVQETFLRVYTALPRFNGRYQLGAWVARIATNVCLDKLRTDGRRPHESGAGVIDELAEFSADETLEPESVFLRRLEARRVHRHLDLLPPMHRAAIILRDFQGFSYEEIASTLDISEQQVKALLHRARARFKRDWIGSFSLLLPLKAVQRLIHRPKVVEGGAGSAAQAAAPLQAAGSCSGIIQQCGQLLGERAMSLAAVSLLGVAAVSGGVDPRGIERPAPAQSQPTEAVPGTDGAFLTGGSDQPAKKHKKKERRPAAVPSTPAEDTEPSDADVPVPTPTPSPTAPPPIDDDDGTGTETPPPPPPEPRPFTPSMGFDRGAPLVASSFGANEVAVDCDAGAVTQHLEVALWDGDQSYPATVDLSTGSSLGAVIRLQKDGYEVRYDAGAALISSTRSKGDLLLSFRGSYGSQSSPNAPEDLKLPKGGRIGANIQVDCALGALVTEELVLSIE